MKHGLTFPDRFKLNVQIWIDWLFMLLYGWFVVFLVRVVRGHQISNIPGIRERYREYMSHKKPTLVCANHLTMADSFLINHALSSVPRYFFHFKTFPWNVPAYENYKGNLFYRLMTYLGACVPINRLGDAEHHQKVQNKLLYLLRKGYVVTFFPEGTRSRIGVIDMEKVSYAVGYILKELDDYQVVTVYCRGDRQKTYSNFPAKGDPIYMDVDRIEPKTEQKGNRAARDIAQQIIRRLKEMEDEYFEKYPERRP